MSCSCPKAYAATSQSFVPKHALTEALHPPFAATWRDPDDPVHAEPVTVLGVASVDARRGILLHIRRRGGNERRVLAEHVWATETASPNAIVLADYRYWVAHGGLDA